MQLVEKSVKLGEVEQTGMVAGLKPQNNPNYRNVKEIADLAPAKCHLETSPGEVAGILDCLAKHRITMES